MRLNMLEFWIFKTQKKKPDAKPNKYINQKNKLNSNKLKIK